MDRRIFLKSAAGAFCLSAAHPWTRSLAAPSSSSAPLLFGVDYYPDQTDESLWEEDARRMADFGVTNVRIAEFAWSLMEPSEGHYDFAWLRKSIEILRAHNIAIILGTPSAAPPPWLTQKYPEVLIVTEQGMTLSPEGRRFTCPSNKLYRRLSVNIATEMAKTFAETPGIIGWQIDNEYTLAGYPRCYCHVCRAGFQEWLKAKYASLDAINKSWGTVFWSQVYTDFSQIPLPTPSGGPPNPGLKLDYDRYQSHANVASLEDQLAVLRKLCPKHFITTNNVPMLADTINAYDLFAKLDFVSYDNYPGYASTHAHGEPGQSLPLEQVAATVALLQDASRSILHGKPFLVMEEQSGKAGQPEFSPQPDKGQLRLWSYQAVAHGAMGINYFRWDTATFGAEEYWHGLLNHDRSKSPGFDEIAQTIRELKSLGNEILNSPCEAPAALCFDFDSDWATAIQPGQPQVRYNTEFSLWYGALWSGHVGVDLVDATGDLSRYKVLFAPLMYIVSDAQANAIREFVRAGGVFVSGFRLGVKNPTSQIVKMPRPGLLSDVMGVTLIDYVPIYSEKQGVKFSGLLAGPDAECQIWADVLKPASAEVLATYTMGDYAGQAAMTSNVFGKGRAFYLGARTDSATLGRLLNTIAASAGIKPELTTPPGVEVATRRVGQSAVIFVLNHTSEPQTVALPGTSKDLLSGATLSTSITLERYGVRVLQAS
ncbi:MAG TPA: beta-galactosidase [Candidatus Eisenbacteria bacterium]|nr:beta-galactosidase [Candidatus Eisenbacteria bacterium]